MFSQLLFKLRRTSQRLWVRTALISLLALVAVGLAPLAGPVLPRRLSDRIDADAARTLLDILANSMLSVTTFSLTVMVTAHFAAQNQATPRAHRLLREDTRTQTVLATFVGAFIYALASIVLLQVGIHSEQDLTIVYLLTLVVIALVIVAILRWIGHLAGLGSLEETARRVEEAARSAIEQRMRSPFLGAYPLLDTAQIPAYGVRIPAPRSGYVQHVDASSLGETTDALSATAFLIAQPGDWVNRGDAILALDVAAVDGTAGERLAGCVTIGDLRTYEQDAEFGVMVVGEIAERALSPTTHDPRTAVAMIFRLVRLLDGVASEKDPSPNAVQSLRAAPIDIDRLFRSAFEHIARDGARFPDVALELQRGLRMLAERGPDEIVAAATRISQLGLAYSERMLALEEDRARVRAAALAQARMPAGTDAGRC